MVVVRLFLSFTTNWYYCVCEGGGGCSANVSSLTYGLASDSVEQESHVSEQDVLDYSNSSTLPLELINDAASGVEDHEESGASTTSAKKRPANYVPQLIDNKREHLKKALSAAQRDKMLLEEAKEDARFRKKMTESMNQSSITFAQGIKDVSKAILEMGAGLSRSIEMVSQGFIIKVTHNTIQ